MKTLIAALQAYETDRIFGAAQIILVPALIFLACMVYGTP